MRVLLVVSLVITLATSVTAHEGSIGIWTDETGTDCDMTFTPYLSFEVTILYFKSDAGPNGITAAQFKVEMPPAGLTIQSFTPSPDVSIAIGDITTGISLAFTNCSGAGENHLLLGTIEVVAFVEQYYLIGIVPAEDIDPRNPPVAVRVTMCDNYRTKHAVLGDRFCSPNGCCCCGAESSSWGAIKGLYRQ